MSGVPWDIGTTGSTMPQSEVRAAGTDACTTIRHRLCCLSPPSPLLVPVPAYKLPAIGERPSLGCSPILIHSITADNDRLNGPPTLDELGGLKRGTPRRQAVRAPLLSLTAVPVTVV